MGRAKNRTPRKDLAMESGEWQRAHLGESPKELREGGAWKGDMAGAWWSEGEVVVGRWAQVQAGASSLGCGRQVKDSGFHFKSGEKRWRILIT